MAELLRNGPEVRPDGPRSRRWLVLLAVLALVTGAAVLHRSTREPAAAPVPLVAAGPLTTVVSVAVGRRWAYALVAVCDARIVHECDYRLRRRELPGSGWQPTPMHVTGRTTTSLDVRMRVGPPDRVTLVAGDTVLDSADGGRTVTTAHLRPGSPVERVPAGSILATGLCEGCDNLVTTLDPATGQLHPLAVQPAFTGFGVRLTQDGGGVLWAAQIGPAGGFTAASPDRGRSWRTIPLAAGLWLTAPVVLTALPGGGAYLVGRRADKLLPDVRRIDGPRGTWQRLTPDAGPVSPYSVVVDERGLLVGDSDGQAWRLAESGTFLRLPDLPGYLAGGPGTVLLGLPSTPGTVLLSWDGGLTWRPERITP